jgi:3',5'-cyclic-AMP phosphodiesterase
MTNGGGDRIDRRGFLECMGWAGTGTLFTFAAGTASSISLDAALAAPAPRRAAVKPFTFVQISDTHVGFSKAANPDTLATLKETIAKIKALPVRPDFVLHTGDITHLATPEQFDLAQSVLSELGAPVHFVPGEHDIVEGTDPRPYLDRFGKGTKGDGWYSFDAKGVHFVALVNVVKLGDRGQGTLGARQIAWLRDDLAHLSSSTPIVVLSHFPLWPLFPDWGWGTVDSTPAMTLLRRFGSVTVLNGHIHQVQQHVEGHIVFHTARSTAYPQSPPGEGAGPGPLVVAPERLRDAIGLRSIEVRQSRGPLATIDTALSARLR